MSRNCLQDEEILKSAQGLEKCKTRQVYNIKHKSFLLKQKSTSVQNVLQQLLQPQTCRVVIYKYLKQRSSTKKKFDMLSIFYGKPPSKRLSCQHDIALTFNSLTTPLHIHHTFPLSYLTFHLKTIPLLMFKGSYNLQRQIIAIHLY